MGQNGVWTHVMLTIVQYPVLDWSALLNHTDFGCDYLGGEQTISGFVHLYVFSRGKETEVFGLCPSSAGLEVEVVSKSF